MKRILIRASKTPFENLATGPIPRQDLRAVYRSLNRAGTKNIGNLVFAHSAYKALSSSDAELTIDNYRLSLDDNYADIADEINERFDVFVIPLCNSFRPSYKDVLVRMTNTIRKLKIPCVVTGVGAQTNLAGDVSRLDVMKDEAKDFVAAILDRSESIGVRGPITRDFIKRLGFDDSRIDVIGCPSMFYNGKNMKISKPDSLGAVALNLSSAVKDPAYLNFASYFNENPEGVTYVPQVRELMPSFFKKRLPSPDAAPSIDTPTPRVIAREQVAFLCDVVPWLDFMRTQSFAIGTRIHGNVVPLLAGTPAHVIAHDSRTLELAEYFEIPKTEVPSIRKFDLRETFERSDYSKLEKNHPARLATYAKFLERNGLDHILHDEQQLAAHDAAVRSALAKAGIPAAA
ncbi:hypothetical protein J2Y48_002908 [Mycoplana sp. BE70]|uniref:polysaccharide pyruvyl transferase family protein n=1 Tax=Mycoplana sp. BE70 TaxID=2817775 RepID=UPI0028616665|nr:polysaccharide pyruvyl transferase family protein [Mycoplana sp. BE70]MDR6757611.1 hypothetical protein [Mycoplana sp. BE70]